MIDAQFHRAAVAGATRIAALAIALASALAPLGASARAQLGLEGQVAWQGRNDVQSPNDASATRFSLDALTGDGPVVTPRIGLLWPIGSSRHELLGLVQPLRIDETGAAAASIRFEGATFGAGSLRARYRFDSWRVGWRYRWVDRPELVVRLGATAKIRDARIELIQGATRARKDNTGFVPLLHASVERPVATGWSWALDIDALAGGPGYAVDAGAVLRYALTERWLLQGGIRFLDGGADNDEVYAFARFTGVTVGLVRRF